MWLEQPQENAKDPTNMAVCRKNAKIAIFIKIGLDKKTQNLGINMGINLEYSPSWTVYTFGGVPVY